MAKFNVEVELDWLNEDSYSIDEEIKDTVVRGVKDELMKKTKDEVIKKLDSAIAEKIAEATEVIAEKIDDFIAVICEENISKISIPHKNNYWSEDVQNIPITEFIGMRFEQIVNEKKYDKNFQKTSYKSDAVYSMADGCIRKFLNDTLTERVEKIVKKAQADAEKTIVSDLERTLRENLTKETVERMNIPQVLENLQKRMIESEG